MGQLASAPGAHPPEVIGVGPCWGFRCGWPAGVSGVGPHSANLGVSTRASGELWGCLSGVHHPAAEGGVLTTVVLCELSELPDNHCFELSI